MAVCHPTVAICHPALSICHPAVSCGVYRLYSLYRLCSLSTHQTLYSYSLYLLPHALYLSPHSLLRGLSVAGYQLPVNRVPTFRVCSQATILHAQTFGNHAPYYRLSPIELAT